MHAAVTAVLIVGLLGRGGNAAAQPSYAEELQARARALRLAESREWRNLLHYRWSLTGRRSEVSSPSFFLSPTGAKDPEAELRATLAAFFEAGPEPDKRAACRFPARFAWLKEKLGFDPSRLPDPVCPAFEEWKRTISPDRVSLIFADAYMDNPSSMYGHTFLLFHRKGAPSGERLLDTVVNFAAEADTENGVLFALYGLIGVFPGKFSAMPYYLKVQEYTNLESRDLWEYELDLSSSAVDRLLMHLWDLGDASFPYYFLSKNCSWQLMPALDVAEPSLHLADRWPLYLVPLDTVKAVARKPGLVAERRYRPSNVTLLLYHRGLLSKEEREVVEALVHTDDEDKWRRLASLALDRRPLELWTASELLEHELDYRRNPDPVLADRQREVHVELGALGVQAQPPSPPPGPAPEDSHGTARWGLGGGARGSTGFEEFDARAALHDVLDDPAGYVPSSTLEMFGLKVRAQEAPAKAWIEDLNLVRILSLSPLDPWLKKPSWEVDAGVRAADELNHEPWRSDYWGTTLGSGLSAKTRLIGTETWFALAEADGGAGDVFRHGHRVGLGGTVGVLCEPLPRWGLKLDASDWDYLLGDRRNEGRLRLETSYELSKAWALRLRLQSYGISDEAMLMLHRYF